MLSSIKPASFLLQQVPRETSSGRLFLLFTWRSLGSICGRCAAPISAVLLAQRLGLAKKVVTIRLPPRPVKQSALEEQALSKFGRLPRASFFHDGQGPRATG